MSKITSRDTHLLIISLAKEKINILNQIFVKKNKILRRSFGVKFIKTVNITCESGKNRIKNRRKECCTMKKIVGLTGVILIACMMISSLFAPANSVENTSATNDFSVLQDSGKEDFDYIIKAEKGYIVVYKKGENEPYLTTDCRVSNLPKGDALYLEKGIEIKGKENLMRALEDYCS